MLKFDIEKIRAAAKYGKPIFVDNHKICVFDVGDRTLIEWHALNEGEFEPQDYDAEYEVNIIDDAGIRRGQFLINFFEEIIRLDPICGSGIIEQAGLTL